MNRCLRLFPLAVMVLFVTTFAFVNDGHAKRQYGEAIDAFCITENRLPPTPYNNNCALCHQGWDQNPSWRTDPVQPAWNDYLNGAANGGDYSLFCQRLAADNQPPSRQITNPATDINVTSGSRISFSGTGSDPEGDTPLSYRWNFGNGTTSTAQNPSNVLFTNSTGSPQSYTVTLSVTDVYGAVAATPASVQVTVSPPAGSPPVATITSPAGNQSIQAGDSLTFEGTGSDPDGDISSYGWNFGDGRTSTQASPGAVAFNTAGVYTVRFTVTDASGQTDTDQLTVTVTGGDSGSACSDADGDGFSPEGGVCGPTDANDQVAGINPGAHEICDDGIDNDQDGKLDLDDEECIPDDEKDACQTLFFGPCQTVGGTGLSIWRAKWEDGDGGKLKVEGRDAPVGATVQIVNADTNDPIGSAVVRSNGHWEFLREHIGSGPCRVRAGVDGVMGDALHVENAPADCTGGVGVPGENTPVIRNANWRTDESALRVSGGYDFTPGTLVTVLNAITGSVVGTTRARDDGEFRFKAEDMQSDQVPCRVKVEVGGLSSNTANVSNAPANCDDVVGTPGGDDGTPGGGDGTTGGDDGTPGGDDGTTGGDDGTPGGDDGTTGGDDGTTGGGDGTGTSLSITTAIWEISNGGTLRVAGGGAPGNAIVEVFNANTNQIVATVAASGNGDWEINETHIGGGPCSVKARVVGGVFGDPKVVENTIKCVQ